MDPLLAFYKRKTALQPAGGGMIPIFLVLLGRVSRQKSLVGGMGGGMTILYDPQYALE